MVNRRSEARFSAAQADQLRRIFGAYLRPKESLATLAQACGVDYVAFRDFMRSRSNRVPTEGDKQRLLATALEKAKELGLVSIDQADSLEPYKPRVDSRRKSNLIGSDRLLLERINRFLGAIDLDTCQDLANYASGVYDAYRILPDRVVKSKYIVVWNENSRWLESIEAWVRNNERIEFRGYVFPTGDFLYGMSLNRDGVWRTTTLAPSGGNRKSPIFAGLMTAHAPRSLGEKLVMAGRIAISKEKHIQEWNRPLIQYANLSDTGDIRIDDVPDYIKDILTEPTMGYCSPLSAKIKDSG